MRFTKMHGAGNDYIYVDGINQDVNRDPDFIKRISDRHFGVGADGMIVLEKSELYDFKMAMYNADGSQGQMCGNGIRCLGKFAYDHHLTNQLDLRFETLAGLRTVHLLEDKGQIVGGRVDMGEPTLLTSALPMKINQDNFVNEPLNIMNHTYQATAVSVGNPHLVLFVDQMPDDLTEIGEALNHDPRFPEGVNVEFVTVIDHTHIKMRVYERGSGETLACGTGACAAAYACIIGQQMARTIEVELSGGKLQVDYSSGHLFLTGEACTVFEGDY